MTTMRGAFLYGNRTVEIRNDVEMPTPACGEVLIRVEANGICGSDLSSFRGQNPRARFPKMFGHEASGVVEDVGPGVDRSWVGLRVAVESDRCCGTCRYCVAGLSNVCKDYHVIGEGPGYPGGCADFLAAPTRYLHVLPDSLAPAEGALVQPLGISYEAAVNRGKATTGDRVLVVGAGPIGLGAMIFAQLEGAEVTIVDLIDTRLELARALGATAMRADDPDLAEKVFDWTEGHGVDLSIEAVGGKQRNSLDLAQQLTTNRGRMVVMGSFSDETIPFRIRDLNRRELTVNGSVGHPCTFAPVVEHITAGRVRPADLISHQIPLENAREAFAMLDERREGVLKIVISP